MMIRTQIMLDAEDHRRAKRRAGELGVSFAEYVRRVLARDLGGDRPSTDPTELYALFDSGGSDVATHKDRYLDEAFAEDASSRRR